MDEKKYENIQEKLTEGYDDGMKALEIVKEFIIRKKLILYGGMSIDLSLKLAGHEGIYDDDTIPDYDFYSPDYIKDSYELADILYEKGFNDVNAINAAHISTRRVRINNTLVVADISYQPPNIFDNLPFLLYKKLRVIHPNYQRMDMHRTMCYLYENPPMETFSHRIKKDIKRFAMLNNEYHIFHKKNTSKSYEFDIIIPENTCIAGSQAYAYMLNMLRSAMNKNKKILQKADQQIANKINKCMDADISFYDNKMKGYTCNPLISFYSNNFIKLANNISDEKNIYYNAYGDSLRPRTIITDNYEIFDNKGCLLSAYKIGKNIYMACISSVCLYSLQKYFDTKDDKWLHQYKSCLIIIEIAEYMKSINCILDYSPWFITADYYGKYNWSPLYQAYIWDKYNSINYITENMMIRPKHGYYPDNKNVDEEFDIKKARFLQYDGKKVDTLLPITLPIIV